MAGKRKGKRFTHCVIWKRERKNIILFNARVYPAKKNGSISVFHCFLYHQWLMTNISVSYLFVWFGFHFLPDDSWMMHAELPRAIMWFVTFFCFLLKNMSNFNMLFIHSIWLEFLFIFVFVWFFFDRQISETYFVFVLRV